MTSYLVLELLMNIDWPMFRICHSSTVNDLYFPKSINFALLRHEHRFVCGELYNVFFL